MQGLELAGHGARPSPRGAPAGAVRIVGRGLPPPRGEGCNNGCSGHNVLGRRLTVGRLRRLIQQDCPAGVAQKKALRRMAKIPTRNDSGAAGKREGVDRGGNLWQRSPARAAAFWCTRAQAKSSPRLPAMALTKARCAALVGSTRQLREADRAPTLGEAAMARFRVWPRLARKAKRQHAGAPTRTWC